MQYTANINIFDKVLVNSTTSSLSPSQSYAITPVPKLSTDIVSSGYMTFDALKAKMRDLAYIPSGSVFEEEILKLTDAPKSLVYSGSMVVEYTNPYYSATLRAYSGSVSVDPEPTSSVAPITKTRSKKSGSV